MLGTYAPQRLNTWAEYAKAVPNLDRAFAFAGVERHEKEKQALIAHLVDAYLCERAAKLSTEGTVRGDELAVGDVLEAVDVRWFSHSPVREVFTVSAIAPEEDGMLSVTFTSQHGTERARSVKADRRFLKAVR